MKHHIRSVRVRLNVCVLFFLEQLVGRFAFVLVAGQQARVCCFFCQAGCALWQRASRTRWHLCKAQFSKMICPLPICLRDRGCLSQYVSFPLIGGLNWWFGSAGASNVPSARSRGSNPKPLLKTKGYLSVRSVRSTLTPTVSKQGERRLISKPCQRSYGNQVDEMLDAAACTCHLYF